MKSWALFALVSFSLGAQTPDCSLIPGWKQHGETRVFESETLFDYMDGNSEGYLIYGFAAMRGVTCKSGEDTYVIDISEMDTSDSAYGIYTANRDPAKPEERIGMAGQITARKAVFVKDRFYVEISAEPDKDHSAAMRQYFALLEKKIEGKTDLPESLKWFPPEQRTSLRLVPESVLGLRLLRRGYVGEYEFGKAFVVKEDSPEAAAGVLAKLRARFGEVQPVQIGDEAFHCSDRYLGRLTFFRKGTYLGGYGNVKEPDDPTLLARKLAEVLP
jgi:hypothetical protein